MDQGYQENVGYRAAHIVRASSQKIYDSKWNKFAKCATGSNIDPFAASYQDIGAFFTHLFEDDKLSVSTIRGYKAASGESGASYE